MIEDVRDGSRSIEIGLRARWNQLFSRGRGAKSVIGIGLDIPHMKIAETFAQRIASHFQGAHEVCRFSSSKMNVYHMTFPENSFDMVVTDNSFEHFSDPAEVLRQSYRVLRPGGRPWCRFFFDSQQVWAPLETRPETAVGPFVLLRKQSSALHRLEDEEPRIKEWYPGLTQNPQKNAWLAST